MRFGAAGGLVIAGLGCWVLARTTRSAPSGVAESGVGTVPCVGMVNVDHRAWHLNVAIRGLDWRFEGWPGLDRCMVQADFWEERRMNALSRYRGCLVGLAVGDAVGTTVEFCPPGTFDPVTDMVGGGPFDLDPGEWTDDTSMALCLAESLTTCDGFDARDQMQRYVAGGGKGTCRATGSASTLATRFEQHCSGSSTPTSPMQVRRTPIPRATAASCAWRRCRCSSQQSLGRRWP